MPKSGDRARKVMTSVIGAFSSANMEVSSMPMKKGTTTDQRRTSDLEPMWIDGQPQLRSTITVKIICKPTSVQGARKAWAALELNNIMPTEHIIQLPTPKTYSKGPPSMLVTLALFSRFGGMPLVSMASLAIPASESQGQQCQFCAGEGGKLLSVSLLFFGR
mmetsp:Transcript_70237/g.139112  ORF Transcript_70237/g.139112 Transcript_70237/m.139112 type:complete len:162 (-) Transcript_70237:64-549(-)